MDNVQKFMGPNHYYDAIPEIPEDYKIVKLCKS